MASGLSWDASSDCVCMSVSDQRCGVACVCLWCGLTDSACVCASVSFISPPKWPLIKYCPAHPTLSFYLSLISLMAAAGQEGRLVNVSVGDEQHSPAGRPNQQLTTSCLHVNNSNALIPLSLSLYLSLSPFLSHLFSFSPSLSPSLFQRLSTDNNGNLLFPW